MIFTNSLDESARKKTKGFILMIISLAFLYSITFKDNWIVPLIFVATFLLIFFGNYLLKPYKYQLNKDNIIVYRLIGKILINRQDIKSIEQLHSDILKDTNRGGLFGYFGKFKTESGKMNWYGTRRDKIVLITTKDNRQVVITPDEPSKFVYEFSL